jgi:hypothetical protein
MNTVNATPFYRCSLVLRVSAISADATPANYPITNSIGTISAGRLSYTWYSLDMKEILGDLYDKFDYFLLRLSTVQADIGIGAYGTTANDRLVNFHTSGPQWINSTYNVVNKRSRAEAVIGAMTLPGTGVATTLFLNDNFTTTFQKTPTMDFTINLNTLNNATPATNTATTLYPLMNFYFQIIPVQFPTKPKYPDVY